MDVHVASFRGAGGDVLQILVGVSGLALEVRPDMPIFQEYPRVQVGDCLSRPFSREFGCKGSCSSGPGGPAARIHHGSTPQKCRQRT